MSETSVFDYSPEPQVEAVGSERQAAFERWCVTYGVQPWARPIANEAFNEAWQARARQVPQATDPEELIRAREIIEQYPLMVRNILAKIPVTNVPHLEAAAESWLKRFSASNGSHPSRETDEEVNP